MKLYSVILDIHKISSNVIRLACTIQLRVLITMMKNPKNKFTSEQIASELKKNINEIEEALEFWINLKIIGSDDEPIKSNNEKKVSKIQKKEYLSERIEHSKEIKMLLEEMESILGRPLCGSDMQVIAALKDVEGLPCDVILMLIQYCVKIKKGSTRYIEKVGKDWADLGIDSVSKAEERIKFLDLSKKSWKKFEKIVGNFFRPPTPKEEETVTRWFSEWKLDESLVKEAYERCVNSKGRYILSYMDGIIKKWQKSNIKTIQDIEKLNKFRYKFKSNPSYNIDEYASFNVFD